MNRASKYKEMWDIIVAMAKAKLLMNAHKGDIEDIPIVDLIEAAGSELEELQDAIQDGNYMGIIEEAADVLNFTTAAVYKAVHEYRNRKNASTNAE